MYTTCPHCQTPHKVTAETLSSAAGVVRCTVCQVNFDALPRLTDRLPRGAHKSVDGQDDDGLQEDLFTREKRPESLEMAPEFVSRRHESKAPRSWPWWMGSVLLALLLAGQYAYAKRDWLLREAKTRPYLVPLCEALKCKIRPLHSPQDIVLISRDVRPHPSVAGALLIEATLVNRAAFDVAYPDLEIALADLNDQVTAMRRFSPVDYLGESPDLSNGLAPRATALISLEVEDPGRNAVAFRFEFR